MHKEINFLRYNTGISVLKIWMVMSVVVCHFLDTEQASAFSRIFTIYGGTAVPVLIFVSFILTNLAVKNDCARFIHRLYRLILPHVFFSILYFLIYMFITPISGGKPLFKDLFLQLLFGADFNPPMWFLVDLIVLTIMFYLVFHFCKGEIGVIACIVLAGISIYGQYSGANFYRWSGLPGYAKWTIGRLVELIPVAVLGIIFSYYEIGKRLQNHKGVVFIGSAIFLTLLYKFGFFVTCEGFYYQGISYLVIACLLSCLFFVAPFEKISGRVCIVLNKWSCYSMGVIAMHYLVRSILQQFWGGKDCLLKNVF